MNRTDLPSRRGARTAAALGLAAGLFAVAGCGGGTQPPPATIAGTPDAKALGAKLTQLGGVPLVLAEGDGQRTLSPAATKKAIERYGAFTIHVVTDPETRRKLLTDGPSGVSRDDDGLYETLGGEELVKDYGRGVLLTGLAAPEVAAGEPEGPTLFTGGGRRSLSGIDRVIHAALSGRPPAPPAADAPCPASGAIGACTIDGLPVEIVASGTPVETSTGAATLLGFALADRIAPPDEERPPVKAYGRFLVLRYRIAPTPEDEDVIPATALEVDGRTYTPLRVSAELRNIEEDPSPLRIAVFDLPKAVLGEALRSGQQLLPPEADDAPEPRIALAGARRLTLKGALDR